MYWKLKMENISVPKKENQWNVIDYRLKRCNSRISRAQWVVGDFARCLSQGVDDSAIRSVGVRDGRILSSRSKNENARDEEIEVETEIGSQNKKRDQLEKWSLNVEVIIERELLLTKYKNRTRARTVARTIGERRGGEQRIVRVVWIE